MTITHSYLKRHWLLDALQERYSILPVKLWWALGIPGFEGEYDTLLVQTSR